MNIKVLFFASLREAMGRSNAQVVMLHGNTVSDLWALLTDSHQVADSLCSVNEDYATLDQCLKNGDEVAFFPPVTGG